MQHRRIAGYALLGLVDAFGPSVAATYTVSYVAAWRVAAYAGILVLGVGFVLGAVIAARGGRPLPLTHGVKRLFERFWRV